jgi:DNA-binding NarL/FixJ family response regulator
MPKRKPETTTVDHLQSVPGAHRQQVLQWLVDGLDVPTIARRINRKPPVVQRHVDELLKRLGAATPAEALEKIAEADAADLAGEASMPQAAEPQPATAG